MELDFVGGHADVWRLFDDVDRLRELALALVEPFGGYASKVAGIEARGFILGTAAAMALGVGFIPVRKAAGLLPGPKRVVESEADYRGCRHVLRVQRAAFRPAERVLLVDDWIETGSQARAAKQLIEACGATLVGIAVIVSELDSSCAEGLGKVHSLARAADVATTDRAAPAPGGERSTLGGG